MSVFDDGFKSRGRAAGVGQRSLPLTPRGLPAARPTPAAQRPAPPGILDRGQRPPTPEKPDGR